MKGGSKLSGALDARSGRPHVGFVLTTPYQLFHYRAIRRHLGGHVSVYVDVRGDDFGLTSSMIESYIGPSRIMWVASDDLGDIDGDSDVIVCQTPVPVMKFFNRSRVVAQQYSLAKEHYQYGVWRSQADLNLMYGRRSAMMSAPFSATIAVGNPLFDGHVPVDGVPSVAKPPTSRPRVLYMPTYGDLSDRNRVLKELLNQDARLSVKAHHADFEIKRLADLHGIPVHLSDADPIELIRDSDLVVSDYSGAIFDALAMRTPVALVESVNSHSKDFSRLSVQDLSRAKITGLASIWRPGEPLSSAHGRSWRQLSDDGTYRAFIENFYVNVGHAGVACAEAIESVAEATPSSTSPPRWCVTRCAPTSNGIELCARGSHSWRRLALCRSCALPCAEIHPGASRRRRRVSCFARFQEARRPPSDCAMRQPAYGGTQNEAARLSRRPHPIRLASRTFPLCRTCDVSN